jgi:hypothetical protein
VIRIVEPFTDGCVMDQRKRTLQAPSAAGIEPSTCQSQSMSPPAFADPMARSCNRRRIVGEGD